MRLCQGIHVIFFPSSVNKQNKTQQCLHSLVFSLFSIDIFRTRYFGDPPRRSHVHTWDAALCRKALLPNSALIRTPSVSTILLCRRALCPKSALVRTPFVNSKQTTKIQKTQTRILLMVSTFTNLHGFSSI